MITPSKYQRDIFDAVLNTDKNIVVQATAGSGKTTTIKEACQLLDRSSDILVTAFNKSIVEELKNRVPNHITCSTLHSIGFKSLIQHFKLNFKVDNYKSFIFAEQKLKTKESSKEMKEKEKLIYKFTLMDMISLVKMNLCPLERDFIELICQRHGLDYYNEEIEDCIEIFSKLNIYNQTFEKKNNVIDFCDMIYIPVTNKRIKLPQYDFIFLDEGQDANKMQQRLVEKLLKPGGRTIIVGDDKQCLYSFAGSDPESFQYFQNKPNTISLPLSISYRCPKKVVENARLIYEDIEPWESAQDGIVRRGVVDEIEPGDMVVCRNNRPLVYLYFELLMQEKSATIVGKDIERGIKKVLNKVIEFDKIDGLIKLQEELNLILEQLKQTGIEKPKNHPRYYSLFEKIQVIEIIGSKLKYMWEIDKKLDELFADKTNAIKLMSGHKSKGLESDRVFYIEKFEGKKLIPSEYAKAKWELEQEKNLLFVISTRAKKEFITITDLGL